MLALFSKLASTIGHHILTTRQQSFLILYASYIWDTVRTEYIESRRKKYSEYFSKILIGRRVDKPSNETLPKEDYLFSTPQYENNDLSKRAIRQQVPLGRRGIAQSYGRVDDEAEQDTYDFECPLPAMPIWLRRYQIFSTVFVIMSIVKYSIVCSVHYRWVEVDPKLICYLPGRLNFLVEFHYEFPLLVLTTEICHIVFRAIWYLNSEPFELDCLLFLCYDKDTILEKQFKLLELNDPKLAPNIAYKEYLCNKIFYERQQCSRGRTIYVLKNHRTVEHYDKMKTFADAIRFSYVAIYSFIYLPMFLLGFYTITTNEYFVRVYKSCSFLSDSYGVKDFAWTYGDWYRVVGLVSDGIDEVLLSIDSSIGLAVPFSGAIIVTQELNIRIDSLGDRMSKLNDKFRALQLICGLDEIDPETGASTRTPMKVKLIEEIEEESRSIFNETISAFKDICIVDKYMRKFSLFCIFVWFILQLTYQLMALSKRNSITAEAANSMFVYFECCFIAIFAFSFLIMSRPHSKATVLYEKFCTAMALCPNIPIAKISWLWLLEYYHGNSARYTLHLIGKTYALSNYNFLRLMSWFVTCIMIMVSLWKHRMNVESHTRLESMEQL